MGNFSTDGIKLGDKSKELGITVKDLIALLNTGGYVYTNYNQVLKPDALQFLYIENENSQGKIIVNNSMENAIIVNVGDKFAVVRILINSSLEVKELSRKVFDSKTRAYYELNYATSSLETGR
jgi:hypothetical protein